MSVLVGFVVAALVFWAALPAALVKQRLAPLRDAQPAIDSPDRLLRVGSKVWSLTCAVVPGLKRFHVSELWMRRLLPALAVLAGLVFVNAALVPIAVGASAVGVLLFRSRAAKARRRAIDRAIPTATDLFLLAISSGSNVTMALRLVAPRVEGPLGEAFMRSLARIDRGDRVAEALDAAIPLTTESAVPLIAALTSSERYGSPLGVVLERLAAEARSAQRREAERTSQRLGVQLLFPVATFTLPAFILLTVAPILAGSFAGLMDFGT